MFFGGFGFGYSAYIINFGGMVKGFFITDWVEIVMRVSIVVMRVWFGNVVIFPCSEG